MIMLIQALPLRRLLLAAVLVAALAPFASLWADELVTSEPEADAVLGEAPEVILLRFDRDLARTTGANSAAILDADGQRLDDGQAGLATYSARVLLVHFAEEVEAGAVSVSYVVQFDGADAPTRGTVAFTVRPGAEPEAPLGPAVVSEPRSDESIVLWTLAIMASIAAFVMGLYFLRVATGNARSSIELDDSEDASH